MGKGRLEAFSDGVIAIILTIMVLEMKVPHGDSLSAIVPIIPVFMSYILSFVYIGIYWNNHHHMMHAVQSVNGAVLWANLHLLFWLSLIPFVTGWMGENHFAKTPVMFYGIVLIMNAIAYTILSKLLIKHAGKNSALSQAVGKGWKGILSLTCYFMGVFISFFNSQLSMCIYTLVAVIWFIPDSRIEKKIAGKEIK